MNGNVLQAQVVKASLHTNRNGTYTVSCAMDAKMIELNPTGRFNLTADQLRALAGNHGVSDFKTLLKALCRGQSSMYIPYEKCVVGEEYTDQAGNTRKYGYDVNGERKTDDNGNPIGDWYKFDNINVNFEFGDAAQNFLDQIDLQVSVQAEMKSDDLDREKANSIRARLALITGGGIAVSTIDPLADDEEETDDAKADPAPARGAKAKKNK